MNTEQIMKLANKLATVSFRYAEEAEEVLREAIEQLVQERDSAVKAAKYAEHIDATPENQRETMLDDALKERDALKAELEQIKAQEPVAWTVAGEVTNWSRDFSKYQTQHYVRPVYAHPTAPAQQPLTLDETMELANDTVGAYWGTEDHLQRFRAAIEQAHGIKGAPL